MAATPASPPLWMACPKCGERLAVRAEDEGKRGRCQKCGEIFRIERPSAEPSAPLPPDEPGPEPDFDDRPALVSFLCELCQTRITTSSTNVGQKIKCPDCGRANVIPQPTPKAGPNIPAAMSGEQYGLWGVDEAPLPAKQAAAATRRHPVHCLRCGTLMYARDEHIGKKLKCPDCGALTMAKASAPAMAKKSVLVEPGEEYQLDESRLRAETPAPAPLSPQEAAVRDASVIPAVATAMAAHKARIIEPPKPRPTRPKNPLVTGVGRMLFTQELIARWIASALVFGIAAQMGGEALLTPIQGMAEAIKIVFSALAVATGAIWLAMTGPLMVVIVGESADGNDQLQQPPNLLAFDWFAELGSAVMATSISGLLALGASALMSFTPAPAIVKVCVVASVVLLVYPFALLSTLLEGSPFGVVSPKLMTTLGRCAGPWALFYLETFCLAAIVGVTGYFLSPSTWNGPPEALVWGASFVAIAALLIDMRLLGRLAWWISDAMPDDENAK